MPDAPNLFPCTVLTEGCFAGNAAMLSAQLTMADAAGMGTDRGLIFAAPVFVTGSCTSTFDVAWELAAKQILPDWAAVIALSQGEGRGQLRRKWHSPSGNLYVSFFLPHDLERQGNLASLSVGWLVHTALRDMGIRTALKWPNDILLQSAGGIEGKFGGILLEERQGRLLAGLGLNLRSAPDDTHLRDGAAVPAIHCEFSGESVCVVWQKLLHGMRKHHAAVLDGTSPEKIRKTIESCLAWTGSEVYSEDRCASGRVEGLTADGALLLNTSFGLMSVTSGSVRLL